MISEKEHSAHLSGLNADSGIAWLIDEDGDGYGADEGDCNDTDANLLFSLECEDESYRFVPIASGTFQIGSPESEPGHYAQEAQHSVELRRGFYLLSTEVTQAQFRMAYPEHITFFSGESKPIEQVSWHQAVSFANFLSEKYDLTLCYDCSDEDTPLCKTADDLFSIYDCDGFRLPTEAEWEVAARAGSENALWTPAGGGDISLSDLSACTDVSIADFAIRDYANYCNGGANAPNDVGLELANDFGLYDMAGNIYEWVHDIKGPYETEAIDPAGPVQTASANEVHVMRGGYYDGFPLYMRSAFRWESQNPSEYIGFRLAISAPVKPVLD